MEKAIACTVLLAVFSASYSHADDDVTKVGALFEEPQTYQLHDVILRGRIENVRPVAPYIGRLGPVHDPCTFMLEDGTGMIEVQVGQGCPADDLARLASTNELFEVRGRLQMFSTADGSRTLIVVGFRLERMSE